MEEHAVRATNEFIAGLITSDRDSNLLWAFGQNVTSHRTLLHIVQTMIDRALENPEKYEHIAVLVRDIKTVARRWVYKYVKPLYISKEEAGSNAALQTVCMAAVQTVLDAVVARSKTSELGTLALTYANKIHAATVAQAATFETPPKVDKAKGGAASCLDAGAGASAVGGTSSTKTPTETLMDLAPYKQVADLVNGKSTYVRAIELLEEELEQVKGMPVEPGWYFDQSGNQQTPPPVKCSRATDEASALKEGISRSRLVNLLGTRMIEEFKRQDQFDVLIKAQREDDKELSDAVTEGTLTKPLRDWLEQRRVERVAESDRLKKRALSSVSFIGHIFLYKVKSPTIIQVCLKHLMHGRISSASLDAVKQAGESPDELSVECLCMLMLQVGGPFSSFERAAREENPVYYPIMPEVLEVMDRLRFTEELCVRLRFLCHDVLDAEKSGWPVDAYQLAAVQTNTTQQEEFQNQVAEEARAAAIAQHMVRRLGGSRGGGGRDFRHGGGGGGRHGHGGRQDSGRRLHGAMSMHGGTARAVVGLGGPMLTRNTSEGAKGAAFMRARGRDPAVGGRAPGSSGSSSAARGSTGGRGGRTGRDVLHASAPSRDSGDGSSGGRSRYRTTTGGLGAARGGAGGGASLLSPPPRPVSLKMRLITHRHEKQRMAAKPSTKPGKEPAYVMTNREVELKAISMLEEYKSNEGLDSRSYSRIEDAALDFEEGLKADPATFAYRFVGYACVGMLDSHGPKLASTVAPVLVGLAGKGKLGKEDIQKGLWKGMEKFSSVAMEAPKLPQFFDEILGGLLEAGLIDYDTIQGMLARAVAVGKGIACFAGPTLKAAAAAKVSVQEVEMQLARLAPASAFDLGQGAPKLSPECKSALPSLVQAVEVAKSMDGCNPEAVAAAAAKGARSAAPRMFARVISVAACGACGNRNRKDEAGMAAAVRGIAGSIREMLGDDPEAQALFLEGIAGVVREDFMFPVGFGPSVIVGELRCALSGEAASALGRLGAAPGPAGPKPVEQVLELLALLKGSS